MGKYILAVFHDNKLSSGATKSFLSNIEYMVNTEIKVIAVVPKKKGDLCDYLKKNNIITYQMNYGGNVYAFNKNRLFRFKGYIRCMFKSIISYCNTIVLVAKIKPYNIDAVYVNTSTIYYGAWVAKRIRARLFWHFREFCLEDQNSLRIWERHFVRIANRAETIFTISNVIDQYYRDKYGFHNTQMTYNDISDIYSEVPKIEHKGINILITGTICEEKGQRYAIDAVHLLRNENVHLFIAGEVNDYAEGLMKYVRKQNITNVTFCGLVKNMNDLRGKIDISLVCAKQEAFGRTIIEDMLAKIIVVGCDRGAVTELVEDRKTGLIYKYGDVQDIANKIRILLKDEMLRSLLIDNAANYAERFTVNSTAMKIRGMIYDAD